MPKATKRNSSEPQPRKQNRKANARPKTKSPASDAGAAGEDLSRFNLFGHFDPQPIAGRQRHLFDDSQQATTSATWPEPKPTGSATFPRPWGKDDPRDRIIAKRFKAEDTATMF